MGWDYFRDGDVEDLTAGDGPRVAPGKITLTQRVAEARGRAAPVQARRLTPVREPAREPVQRKAAAATPHEESRFYELRAGALASTEPVP